MHQNYNQPLELTGFTGWIDSALKSALPEFWVIFIELVLVAVALLAAYAVIAMILIYVERKITAFFQARIGPNRVGPWGLIQPIADGLKLMLKEVVIPSGADKTVFLLAPVFAFAPALVACKTGWRSVFDGKTDADLPRVRQLNDEGSRII